MHHQSRVRAALICCAIIAGGLAMTVRSSAQERFKQDRFAIGFWVDPPMDDRADERYAEIAEANFTLVIGGFGARTPEQVKQQLELCEKYDLRAVVRTHGLSPDAFPESPACWGYQMVDEPNSRLFPELAERVAAIRAARPGRFGYINLLPNYANAAQLGNDTYDEHVASFMQIVNPDVLSMDHYPILHPDGDTRASYCANLEVMRKYALQHDVPFWNFFNTMPYGPHMDLTEGGLRWQIFTSLAYGAKGVLYFCYYTPAGGEFPKGGAIIHRDDRRSRHYYQAQRINAALKNLGPTLMALDSEKVVRIPPDGNAAELLAGTPIRNITPSHRGDFLVGVFRHEDGRRAVLLNNYEYRYTSWPTVEFDAPSADVLEVDPMTGQIAPVIDDSPAMDGLQISLDAGDGRLFILPAAQ